jgi:hypothetical protein
MQDAIITLKIEPAVVIIKLNAVYNTVTQTFDYSPSDYSSDYNN